jgi:hypothetical protein
MASGDVCARGGRAGRVVLRRPGHPWSAHSAACPPTTGLPADDRPARRGPACLLPPTAYQGPECRARGGRGGRGRRLVGAAMAVLAAAGRGGADVVDGALVVLASPLPTAANTTTVCCGLVALQENGRRMGGLGERGHRLRTLPFPPFFLPAGMPPSSGRRSAPPWTVRLLLHPARGPDPARAHAPRSGPEVLTLIPSPTSAAAQLSFPRRILRREHCGPPYFVHGRHIYALRPEAGPGPRSGRR